MVREEARRTLLREYDKWAKDHPDDATKRGGVVFFTYLQKEKSDLLDFHAVGGDKWATVRGAGGRVARRPDTKTRQSAIRSDHGREAHRVPSKILGPTRKQVFGSVIGRMKGPKVRDHNATWSPKT